MNNPFRIVLLAAIAFAVGNAFGMLVLYPEIHSGSDNDRDGFATGVDCDDGDASVHPGADELCGDGVDNDCDGLVDDKDDGAVRVPYCYDGNHDGACDESGNDFGLSRLMLCTTREASSDGTQKQVLNYIRVPEVIDAGVFCFVDIDNDGYGDAADGVYERSGVCDHDRVTSDNDCDDANASTNPSEDDPPGDSVDNNCDDKP